MLPELLWYITALFILSVLGTLYFLVTGIWQSQQISGKKVVVPFAVAALLWLALQSVLGYTGFYRHYNSIPPRFLMAVLPPLAVIAGVLLYKPALHFVKNIPLATLTWLHTMRILVEIVLYYCFLQSAIPQIMTFGGRNFDIIAGLTAPLIAYFGAQKGILQKRHILLWNIICVGLLLNVVITGVLSAPFPFQQFGFSQPNIAVFYFPFTLLPAFIVPAVLFCHLAAIAKLTDKGSLPVLTNSADAASSAASTGSTG